MITLFGRPITFRTGNIMAKGLSKLPHQPSLFDLPKMPTLEQATNEVVEGKTVQKDGHTYEYRRSKKNPGVRRLFRQDEPEQIDMFGAAEEKKPEPPAVSKKPAPSEPKETQNSEQLDLFGTGSAEKPNAASGRGAVIPLRHKKPDVPKEETKPEIKSEIAPEKKPSPILPTNKDLPELKKEETPEEPKPISELKKDAQSSEPEKKPSSAEQALSIFGNTEDEDSFGISGTEAAGKIKKRVELNRQAVEILETVDPIDMTDEQKKKLELYSGRGGVKSATNLDDVSLNEFYTRPVEAKAIWNILEKLGFKGGEGLEPSCGTGVFLKTAPGSTLMTGVELEDISGRIADILHGDNHYVKISSFEKHCAKSEGGMYDVVAGNVPFGDRGASKYDDPEYREYNRHEQYFLMRGLDELTEGGLMALIVHPGVMNNNWQQFRAELNAKGEFIGAIRLPTGAFKHANATTSSDIIFMRKRPEAVIDYIQNATPEQKGELYDKGILNSGFVSGTYYENNPDAKLGESAKGRFGAEIQVGDCTQEMIEDVAFTLNFEKHDYSDLGIDYTPAEERKLQVGDTIQKNGRTYRLNDNHRWERVTEAEVEEMPPSPTQLAAGFQTRAEADKAMNDPAMMVNIPKKHLLQMAYEAGNADLAHLLRRVFHPNATKDEALTKAAVIGLYILEQQRKVQAGEGDSIMAQKLIKMCQDFKDTYGHPVNDLHLDKIARLPVQVKNFLSSFDKDGNIQEHFLDPAQFDAAMQGNVDLIAEHSYNPQAGYSILDYLLKSKQPTGLNTIQALYEGEGDVLQELLSNDEVALDENGDFNLSKEIYSGMVYGKVDAWEERKKELESEIGTNPNAAKYFDKYNQQIIKIKELSRYQQLDDLPVMMNDGGRFFDLSLLNEYLTETMGNDFIGSVEKNEYGMFTFSDPVLAEIYSLYIQKGRGIDKADKKKLDGLLKRFFGTGKDFDRDPFPMLMLNHLNGFSTRRAGAEGMARIDTIEKGFKDYLKGHEESLGIEDRYNRAYNNYIHKDYESTPFEIDGLKEEMKSKVGGHQWQLVRRMLDQGKGLVAHGVGLGKAQPLTSPVLTPQGFRAMGELKIGDEVINSEGKLSKVTGIYPQGVLKAYSVVFSDGSSTICNDEHLWNVRTEKEQSRKKPYRTLMLKEIMPDILTKGNHQHYNYRIPMIQPVQFESKETPVDGYLLGLLLGNGSLNHSTVVIDINHEDTDIIHYCKMIAEEYSTEFRHTKKTNYRFKTTLDCFKGGNLLKRKLDDLGIIGKRSEQKFVPSIYLINDIETRLSVLQGLMDTDGFVAKDGMAVQFTTVSRQLKEDVKFIVQSLGGIVRESGKQGKYFNGNETVIAQYAYTLNISMPKDIVPFRSERKLKRFVPKSKYQPTRIIREVNYVGEMPMQCISVDSPDNLYATDDFILTHNTLEAILLVKSLKTTGKAKKPLVVVPGSVLKNWVNEFNKWIDNPNILVVGMYQDKDGNWRDESAVEMQAKLKAAALNNYDAVIMTRDTFSRIEISPDGIKEPMEDLISRIAPIDPNDKNIKNAKQKYELAVAKITGALENVNPIKGVYLDKLGFDAVIRDEAHDTKNLLTPIVEDVKGADGATSSRAVQNYLFSRIVSGKKNGTGIYMLTATPISNSPTEVFNMMLPFAADDMRELGLDTMDSFIKKFCNRDMKMAMDSAGGVYEEERFAGWKSPQAIQNLFYRYTDYKTKDDVAGINIHIPKEKPNNVLTSLNDGQKALMYKCKMRLLAMRYSDESGALMFDDMRARFELNAGIITQKEYEDVKNYFVNTYVPRCQELEFAKLAAGEIEPGQKVRDHYFKVQADMVKIAADLSWYQEKGSDFSHSIDADYVEQHQNIDKITEMVNSAKAIHESGGKQIIFAQNVVLHPRIKDELIKAGIKPEEITIVNAKTVGNSEKRSKISEEFNAGKYKVVIGNYDTMGEGLNFQVGSTDVHHLQPAWNHRAIEQGNGRAMRQGNSLETVNAHYYLSKGSIDGMMKDKIMAKKDMVDKFLRGESADWDDYAELDPEEMLVALSDNPNQAQALKEARAKRIQEYQNAKETSLALQKMKKFYGIRQKLMKLPENSEVRDGLIKEYNELSSQLSTNPNFKHKETLGLDQHPVIVPQHDLVIPIGSSITRETADGKKYGYIVEKYNPYTSKVTLYKLPDRDSGRGSSKDIIEVDASKLGSVTISNHANAHYKKLLTAGYDFTLNSFTLSKMPADFVKENFKDILQHIVKHQRHDNFMIYDKNGVITTAFGYQIANKFEEGYKLLTQASPNYESIVYNGIQKYREIPYQLRYSLEEVFGRNYKANLKAALKEKGIEVKDEKAADVSADTERGIQHIPSLKLSKLVSKLEQDGVFNSRDATKIISKANQGGNDWWGFRKMEEYVTRKFHEANPNIPFKVKTSSGDPEYYINKKDIPEDYQEKLQQYKEEYGITPYITVTDY